MECERERETENQAGWEDAGMRRSTAEDRRMGKRNEVIMYIAGNPEPYTFHLRSHQLSNWESDGDA